jgi:hypothetical protein
MKMLFLLAGVLVLATNASISQITIQKRTKSKIMQTVRLHIDGFSKSKSGAV